MANIVVYPVIFENDGDGYLVTIPDLDRMTQGENLADAIEMARDLISLWVMDLQDRGEAVPAAGSVKFDVPANAVISYVDANITEYRKKYGGQIVKKNCTLPAWLSTKAEEMGINFSKTLQEALLQKINC